MNEISQEAQGTVTDDKPPGDAADEKQEPTGDQLQAAEEEKATQTGWKPEPEYKGAPDKYRGAKEWNERGEAIYPIMKANNRRLEEKSTALETKLADTTKMLKKLTKVQDKASKDQYAQKLKALEAEEDVAVGEANKDRFQEIRKERADLQEPEILAPVEDVVEKMERENPAIKQWRKENSWFEDDPEMADYAMFIGDKLSEANDPTAVAGREAEFAAKITAKIKAAFPNKPYFNNPNRERSAMDDTSLQGSDNNKSQAGAKEYKDLPQDAKDMCDKLVADPSLPGYTKEKFCNAFEWDEE